MKQPEPTPVCFHCGSPLILISEETALKEGSRFPQTTLKYRCSNQECQDEIDKQTAKRKKLIEDKAIADQKRIEKKNLERIEKNKQS